MIGGVAAAGVGIAALGAALFSLLKEDNERDIISDSIETAR